MSFSRFSIIFAVTLFMGVMPPNSFSQTAQGLKSTDGKTPAAIDSSTETVFMHAFGVTSREGKFIYLPGEKRDIKMHNILILSGLSTELRAILYAKSECGHRQYQYLTAPGDRPGIHYQLIFGCDKACTGVIEQTKEGKIDISKNLPLPAELCSLLWEDKRHILDMNGL